jgi:hypothetical protein
MKGKAAQEVRFHRATFLIVCLGQHRVHTQNIPGKCFSAGGTALCSSHAYTLAVERS